MKILGAIAGVLMLLFIVLIMRDLYIMAHCTTILGTQVCQ